MSQPRIISLLVVILAGSAFGQEWQEHFVLTGHSEYVHSIAFSPDSRTLASLSNNYSKTIQITQGQFKLWDLAAGKERLSFRGHSAGANGLTFSPDGKRLASAGGDSAVRVWEEATGKEVVAFEEPSGSFYRVAFSSDGQRLGAAGPEEVCIWDLTMRKKLHGSPRRFSDYSSSPWAFSPDLGILAVASQQDVDLWDIKAGKEMEPLLDHRGRVHAVSFSADGKTVVVGSSREVKRRQHEAEIKLWDLASHKERATVKKLPGSLRQTVLSQDGQTLAVVTQPLINFRTDLRLVDVASGKTLGIRVYSRGDVAPGPIAFSPDGSLLAAGFPDGKVRVWEINRMRQADKPR